VVSQRILDALGEPYVLPGYLHHSTCSIGVTLFGKLPSSVSELLKQADLAMYQAKAAGRNAVRFFDPEMQAVATANATLAATCARPGAKAPQDRVPAASRPGRHHGGRRGAAALGTPRARHRQPGRLHPDRRGNLADLPIGHWVLEAACAQLRPGRCGRTGATWRSPSTSAYGSSADPEFVDDVLTAVAKSGIVPAS
jgi:hypothetical protein